MVFKCKVPDNWTVEPGIYYLGNKLHPVAVFVPFDDDIGKDIIKHVVDMGVAIAGFCKTANIGLEKAICNILANPNIRFVIVAGNECPGHKSGKAIINLWRYGVNPKTKRILCGPNKPCDDIPTGYIPNLPIEAIERFRRQVTVIDLIIDGKEVTKENVIEFVVKTVHACVQEPWNKQVITIKGITYELYDPGAFDKEPYIIQITKGIEKSYIETLSDTLTVVISQSIADAYRQILPLIKYFGKDVVTHYGKTKELLNVVIHILNPLIDEIPSEYPLANRNYIEKYCKTLVSGGHIEGYEYSYGERLRRKFGDQLTKLIDKLCSDISTRQGIISLWSPFEDLDSNVSPCITHIQVIVRDDKVHLVAFFRSHDFEKAFIHNTFGLRELMLYIVNELNRKGITVKPGTITMYITSCHMYL